MKYVEGYNYQSIEEPLVFATGIIIPAEISLPFITLSPDGILSIFPGFAWDGPSGLTFDNWQRRSVMRNSAVHDALYRLMRAGLLDHKWRKRADELIYEIGVADGMYKWRARMWYKAVRKFANPAIETPDKIYEAP